MATRPPPSSGGRVSGGRFRGDYESLTTADKLMYLSACIAALAYADDDDKGCDKDDDD